MKRMARALRLNPSDRMRADGSSDPANIKPIALAGFLVIALFFGVFGGWAWLAPLKSAAIAPGVVSVDSSRKTVQHLEGGIVEKIFVRDGDVVSAGQILIQLEKTKADTTLDLLLSRLWTATALEARLLAERDGRDQIDFPDSLLGQETIVEIAEIITNQKNIFEARQKSLLGQTKILEQRVAQFGEEITGLEGELDSKFRQLNLINEELIGLRELFAKQLVTKSRLLELERRAVGIDGEISRNKAQTARARQQIGETQLQISVLGTERVKQVLEDLHQVQSELSDIIERVRFAEDVQGRTEIRAPLDGTIMNLRIHTLGGVIGPGAALLDIVPSRDRLIIEAKIDPSDIDVIHPDLSAYVRLTAFNQRDLVPLTGIVTQVSADLLTEESTGISYYLARIELSPGQFETLKNVSLYPGMQAEVIIVTGQNTALDYLLKPILKSIRRAFREE